jgi:BlaI family penicillinase repressor
MARKPSETLTPREAEVMTVLWEKGTATADEVRRGLRADLHDSTVRTILRVLEAKGYADHTADGKSYVYRATVAREKAQGSALRRFVGRFFGGSPRALVLRLIEEESLTAEDLRELDEETREMRRRRRGKGGR